jgi:class 3 adenylate cyclase/tetratricopeptide (TPR) repeat protein
VQSNSTPLFGESSVLQRLQLARQRSAASGPADAWVLTLEQTQPDRLLTVLGDGSWNSETADGPWPPGPAGALPDSIARALARLKAPRVRLQLRTALDAWPWERELAAIMPDAPPAPRYLTDLPACDHAALLPTPLVATGAVGAAHLELVQAARQQHRPLVVVDSTLAAEQRLALERCLHHHWREPLLLSQALARALAQLGLSTACCRLYGDGQVRSADTEQGWRPITALRIDLVSSTRLLRTLGAEAYAERLQAYHERCSDVILQFQGSLDEPQGDDGLMAYFGFPLAVEDTAARALAAAWQLASGLAGLDLQVRIGAASGQVAVSGQQAFGPEIHLAARLCAAAEPGQILVAASTRDRVGADFLLEPCGDGMTLKDFGNQRGVHRLCGLRPSAFGTGAGSEASGAFVGRRHEMLRLRTAWAAACEGRPQWCVVHGDAGIGKSRLLLEFSRELRAEGRRCLTLQGQSQAGSSPFAAVVDGLRRLMAIDHEVDAVQIESRLYDLLPHCHRIDGGLADLVSLLVPAHGGAAVAAKGGPPRWSELLLACLQALIEPGPFCLLVDDAHWLDPSSIELLRSLRVACEHRPLLVVLGERTETGWASALPVAEVLALQGLSDGEALALARQLGAALSEQVHRRLIERAEGVPLYLEESLHMLNQRDSPVGTDVPAKLEDLLMVRLDELGPDRALAQLVSVLGRECSAVHLNALLEQDDPFVDRARQQGGLTSLLNSGLVQPLDGSLPGYRFKHALIRDAAYGSIRTDDRRRLHGLCADLIERITPSQSQQRPEHLAYHLQAAGRDEQAHRAWQAAAHLAATRHAHQETVDLAGRALALHDRLPARAAGARSAMQMHLLMASAQIALHGYGSAAAEAAYQAAERAGQQLADAAYAHRIRLGLEACYVMRGDLDRAGHLAQAAVEANDWEHDPRLALQSRWALANVRFHQGDWRAALAGFDDCLANYRIELHRGSGVQDPAVMCLGYSSWIHFELGQADEALRRTARMLELAETLQHPFSTGVAMAFAASIKRLCGDVDGAWPHAEEGVRVCERGGFQVWLAHAWMVRGQLRTDRGDVRGGAEDMDRGYDLWVGSGARISCATYLVTRAELYLRQGQTGPAGDELDRAWQVSEQIGEHYYRAELLRLRALCAWQRGNLPHAGQLLDEALSVAQHQGKPGLSLRCALSLGALQALHGDCRGPAQRLRTLLAELPQHGSCRDGRWARRALQSWDAGKAFASAAATPWEPL